MTNPTWVELVMNSWLAGTRLGDLIDYLSFNSLCLPSPIQMAWAEQEYRKMNDLMLIFVSFERRKY